MLCVTKNKLLLVLIVPIMVTGYRGPVPPVVEDSVLQCGQGREVWWQEAIQKILSTMPFLK